MKISILGASGSVGAPTAFYIAVSGLADQLLLLGGKRQNLLEHHTLDISEAASTKACQVAHGGYKDLTGSDIVIIAAGPHVPLHQERRKIVQKQVLFIKDVFHQIGSHCPKAVIISAVNPLDVSNYAAFLTSDYSRQQLIGYSMNDTIRFRASLAEEMEAPVDQIEGVIIGEHGATQVPLFSSVRINGKNAQLTEDMKERIRGGMFNTIKKYETLKAGRTGGWTCAVGITELVRSIVEDREIIHPCSIVLDGEYGLRDMSMGVPVRLGRVGIKEILEYELLPDERLELKTTVKTLKADAAIARETLGVQLPT